MKKLILNLLFLISVSSVAFANPFELDEKSIQNEFEKVNTIETLVNQQQITNYENLKSFSPELSVNLSAEATSIFEEDEDENPLPFNIPPFFWGCCFGVMGIILVAVITDSDKKSVNSAAIGCLITTGVVIASYVVLILSGVLSTTYY